MKKYSQQMLRKLLTSLIVVACSPSMLSSFSPGYKAVLFVESSSLSDCSVEEELEGMQVMSDFEKCSGISSSEVQAVYNVADGSSSSETASREALIAKASECSETPHNEVQGSYGGERDICVAGYMKLMAEEGFFPWEDLLTSCSCLQKYLGDVPNCGLFSSMGGEQSFLSTTTGLCEDIPDVCTDVKLFATECLGATYKDSTSFWASKAADYANNPEECHTVQFEATHCPSTATLIWEAGSSALEYCISSPSGLTKAEYAALVSFSDGCPHYFTDGYVETAITGSSKYNYDITTYPPLLLLLMAGIIGAGCYFLLRRRRSPYSDLKDSDTFGSTLFNAARNATSGFRRKGEPVYTAVATEDGASRYASQSSSSSSSSSSTITAAAAAAAPPPVSYRSDLERGMFGGVLGAPFGGSSSSNAPSQSSPSGGGGYGAYAERNPLDDDENSFTM